MTFIDLSICIVNWNAEKFLIGCLESIYKNNPALKFEIIIVDNASVDNSITQVQKKFPKAKVILNKKNAGFSVGNNVAIKHSSGRYILLLNPDTLVTPGALEAMVKFMNKHQQIGVCGCRLVHPETRKIEASARSFPSLLPLLWNLSYLDRLFQSNSFFNKYLMTRLAYNKVHEVDWVTGACLIVRREVINQVGALDENIFMYCEDVEWCYRIKKAGWKVYYYPKVEIEHYRGQSSKLQDNHHDSPLSVWEAKQYSSSILYFYAKHYGKWRTFLLRCIIVLTSLFKAVLWFFFGSWPEGRSRAMSYLSMIPIAIIKKISITRRS